MSPLFFGLLCPICFEDLQSHCTIHSLGATVTLFYRGNTNPANFEATFAYIADNPSLYNYNACGVNETRETRLQRLRDRFVGIDASGGDLTTIYFSLNPLCEQ